MSNPIEDFAKFVGHDAMATAAFYGIVAVMLVYAALPFVMLFGPSPKRK